MTTTLPARTARWPMPLMVLGHAVDDLYQGAVPALVPFLVAERHYGYLAAAGITVAATLLSSVVQPLFGVLTDRRPMPWLVPVGMTVAGAGIGLSGLADSYALTWLAIALSGLGVAAYHPESARIARRIAGRGHVGMSWFSLGGNVGFALGPIVVTPVLQAGGLGATPYLVLPALVAGVVIAALFRRMSDLHSAARHRAHAGRDDWRQFGWLTVVVVGRSIAAFSLNTFLAIWITQRTGSVLAGEVALVVLFGGWCAGHVAGRCAGRTVGPDPDGSGLVCGGGACGRWDRIGAGVRGVSAGRACGGGVVRAVLAACDVGAGLPAEPARDRQRGDAWTGGERRRGGRACRGSARQRGRIAVGLAGAGGAARGVGGGGAPVAGALVSGDAG
ncbi:MFS transporter [Amycolatopsis sp. cg13]|uniref:MFS transporter n=1 Tax=Amycolatopsis sp. cg13 TaxID=3238807 RepID=UPI003523AC50